MYIDCTILSPKDILQTQKSPVAMQQTKTQFLTVALKMAKNYIFDEKITTVGVLTPFGSKY